MWVMSAYAIDDFLSDFVFAVCSCSCSTPSDDRTADENVSMAAQPGQQGGHGGELGVDDDCRERCLLVCDGGKDLVILVSLVPRATALLMYSTQGMLRFRGLRAVGNWQQFARQCLSVDWASSLMP